MGSIYHITQGNLTLPVDLNVFKEQTWLINKKLENAIKGLTQHKLARVEQTEEGLLVSVV